MTIFPFKKHPKPSLPLNHLNKLALLEHKHQVLSTTQVTRLIESTAEEPCYRSIRWGAALFGVVAGVTIYLVAYWLGWLAFGLPLPLASLFYMLIVVLSLVLTITSVRQIVATVLRHALHIHALFLDRASSLLLLASRYWGVLVLGWAAVAVFFGYLIMWLMDITPCLVRAPSCRWQGQYLLAVALPFYDTYTMTTFSSAARIVVYFGWAAETILFAYFGYRGIRWLIALRNKKFTNPASATVPEN